MGSNPWAGMSSGGDPHAGTMNTVMSSSQPSATVHKQGGSPWSLLNPMRAIEKNPLMAMATGNKWTPIDPVFTGKRAQDFGTGHENGFVADTPWGKWSP